MDAKRADFIFRAAVSFVAMAFVVEGTLALRLIMGQAQPIEGYAVLAAAIGGSVALVIAHFAHERVMRLVERLQQQGK
jgi:hypothetical protein